MHIGPGEGDELGLPVAMPMALNYPVPNYLFDSHLVSLEFLYGFTLSLVTVVTAASTLNLCIHIV